MGVHTYRWMLIFFVLNFSLLTKPSFGQVGHEQLAVTWDMPTSSVDGSPIVSPMSSNISAFNDLGGTSLLWTVDVGETNQAVLTVPSDKSIYLAVRVYLTGSPAMESDFSEFFLWVPRSQDDPQLLIPSIIQRIESDGKLTILDTALDGPVLASNKKRKYRIEYTCDLKKPWGAVPGFVDVNPKESHKIAMQVLNQQNPDAKGYFFRLVAYSAN